MKKILLTAINARYTHSCLALYCLKSVLGGIDATAMVREFSINLNADEITAGIAAEKADVIALSVYIWNSGLVRKLLPVLNKRCGAALLVLGGPEVSYNPASWVQDFPFIDHIVTGHGEEGFRTLALNDFRSNDRIITVPNPPFSEMPIPYTDEDLAGLRNRYIYYESGRGCPFQCAYCLSSRSDQKLELKSFDAVRSELDFILRTGPALVKFVDRTFNADRPRARTIWRYLLDRYSGGPTAFHFEIHPRYLGDEDFDLLSACPRGLFQFEIGVQTTNPAARSAVRRGGDWGRERSALGRLIALGTVRSHLDLIAGLPFDDMETVARSFNEAYGLGPDHLQLGFLKLLPGTEMADTAAEHGMSYSSSAPYQVMENRWLSGNELRLLDSIAFLTDRLYNTGRFRTTLAHLVLRRESPFELFRDLASWQDEKNLPRISRGWESGAGFLAGYAAARFSDEKSFFLDAIRWDWCAVSRSPYYPDLIRPAGLAEIRKNGISYFRGLADGDVIQYEGIRFSLADLKRSIFFRAESEDFRQARMGGQSKALFLPDKNVLVYDEG